MTDKLHNPPAYPQTMTKDTSVMKGIYQGMTLRDYFAGQALVMLPHHGCGMDLDVHDTATAAYQIADAMLKARQS